MSINNIFLCCKKTALLGSLSAVGLGAFMIYGILRRGKMSRKPTNAEIVQAILERSYQVYLGGSIILKLGGWTIMLSRRAVQAIRFLASRPTFADFMRLFPEYANRVRQYFMPQQPRDQLRQEADPKPRTFGSGRLGEETKKPSGEIPVVFYAGKSRHLFGIRKQVEIETPPIEGGSLTSAGVTVEVPFGDPEEKVEPITEEESERIISSVRERLIEGGQTYTAINDTSLINITPENSLKASEEIVENEKEEKQEDISTEARPVNLFDIGRYREMQEQIDIVTSNQLNVEEQQWMRFILGPGLFIINHIPKFREDREEILKMLEDKDHNIELQKKIVEWFKQLPGIDISVLDQSFKGEKDNRVYAEKFNAYIVELRKVFQMLIDRSRERYPEMYENSEAVIQGLIDIYNPDLRWSAIHDMSQSASDPTSGNIRGNFSLIPRNDDESAVPIILVNRKPTQEEKERIKKAESQQTVILTRIQGFNMLPAIKELLSKMTQRRNLEDAKRRLEQHRDLFEKGKPVEAINEILTMNLSLEYISALEKLLDELEKDPYERQSVPNWSSQVSLQIWAPIIKSGYAIEKIREITNKLSKKNEGK